VDKTLDIAQLDDFIARSLQEDVGNGDVTTNALFSAEESGQARMIAKDDGVLAGLGIAERVFRHLSPDISWEAHFEEGATLQKGDRLVDFSGPRRTLLTGERLALNILQRLSGIATTTRRYVSRVAGTGVRILDTRKTLPGLRALEKYAVATGGGTNHRFGLFDAIMIKDNHIRFAGGIEEAVRRARAANTDNLSIEVETSNLEEVRQALAAGVDIIMLDNMSTEMMKEAVNIINHQAKTEASGGIQLDSIRVVAECGVDFISVGALTHSVIALDIGMYCE
jgi:nicotinate-nucleotide pyrophosphorylase (carboxylating)